MRINKPAGWGRGKGIKICELFSGGKKNFFCVSLHKNSFKPNLRGGGKVFIAALNYAVMKKRAWVDVANFHVNKR
jgi:hypothetical protein